jgi:hypothetical protein
MSTTNLPCSPVIILGMHRSGTSLVAQLLESLGLFIGKRKDENNYHEAFFFYNLNRWILKQSGASWEHPGSFSYLEENADARTLTNSYLHYMLGSPRAIGYLGLSNYVRWGGIENLPFPWGWKDPRTTITLPIWLDVFPDAKLIHVLRHGVDVASSLRERWAKKVTLKNQIRLHNKRCQYHLYSLYPKQGGFIGSLRCASLEGGFSLWEYYVKQAQDHLRRYPNPSIEIRYEDFLQNPCNALMQLSEFCELSAQPDQVENLVSTVNKNRAYAFQRNADLQAFAEGVSERLARFGYLPKYQV